MSSYCLQLKVDNNKIKKVENIKFGGAPIDEHINTGQVILKLINVNQFVQMVYYNTKTRKVIK